MVKTCIDLAWLTFSESDDVQYSLLLRSVRSGCLLELITQEEEEEVDHGLRPGTPKAPLPFIQYLLLPRALPRLLLCHISMW
jgi:hypothetical protein